jgi:uncharacterized membrane protein YhaH (DUF805 family)
MDFFAAIKTCLNKYADFTGRAARPEYWWFVLFIFIAYAVLTAIYRPLGLVFDLAVIVPHLAVGARRLHDTDRSAWWLLIGFVPLVGIIVLIVWFCQRSDPNANRFGAAPLPPDALSAET